MAIKVLDPITINKIAAGEVIERPSSVVKELVENAIDAKASAITIEIKEGGISFIRITDNGMGFDKQDIPVAFLRHSTSKITTVEDLLTVSSLGFRGEALSSISAVAQVELISKTHDSLMGTRYIIEGGKEKLTEGVGCPDGTTFIIRNLFYNTPARRKFLKSPITEGGYIADLIEKLALSHPEISFNFISNGQNKLHTSGNGNIKDIIYHIYGRDITSNLLPVDYESDVFSIHGFIGKPVVNRGNRNYENYYINRRYIRSTVLNKAIEEAYKPFMMQHKYPFTVLHFTIDSKTIDVNVHPTKMELRFANAQEIYESVLKVLTDALTHKEFIHNVGFEMKQTVYKPVVEKKAPEPFEQKRILEQKQVEESKPVLAEPMPVAVPLPTDIPVVAEKTTYQQETLFEEKFLDQKNVEKHKIIGQIFDTYWIVEFEDKMYMIDQHAAHEKVLYERIVKRFEENKTDSQMLLPPIIVTLSTNEIQTLKENMDIFTGMGYEVEEFGGKDYAIKAVPMELYQLNEKDVFLEVLDELSEGSYRMITSMQDKMATIACKAAVKGHDHLSQTEAKELIKELLSLDNPYNCPHGRPTIVSMTQYEIERKFKRII